MNDYKDFRAAFDERFFSFLEKKQSDYQKVTPHPRLLQYFKAVPSLASGGKRVRPYVAWLAYDLSLSDTSDSFWNYAMAIEIIHLFALIHDDIMDRSPLRRGEPTLQKTIEREMKENDLQGDLSFAGSMTAMLIGDAVFWSATELLIPKNANIPNINAINEIFSKLVDGVVMGQILDFEQTSQNTVAKKEILEKTLHKTGHYTFSYPMQIGCLTAGQQSSTQEDWYTLGELIGLGYQIQDDILDIIGDPNKTKKPIMADIQSGQHTLLSDYIKTHGTEEQKKELARFWKQTLSPEHVTHLKNVYVNSGAVPYAQEEALRYYQEALDFLQSRSFSSSQQERIGAFISYLQKRDY